MRYLVSALEMAELDRQTIEDLGVPGRTLMEVAGRAVAQACHERLAPAARVVVACGPGNNGGDGYVAARTLAALGHTVQLFAFADRGRIRDEARAVLTTLEKSGDCPVTFIEDARALIDFSNAVLRADLVVDAFFGTGLKNEIRGIIGDAVGIINEHARVVVSVDIPSGVDADTGAVLARAVEADLTVTFAFAKRGHYLFPGAERRGELLVRDIGIPEKLAGRLGVAGRLLTRDDIAALVPRRRGDAHKGSFGTLVVVAGSALTPGAAVLAASAGLRSGAGLVRWATEPETLAAVKALPPDMMLLVRERDEAPARWAERILELASAVVIGPGSSRSQSRLDELRALLESARVPLCLDADALNILADNPDLWALVRTPVIVTPHPKEMSRLTKQSVEEIQRDRVGAALQLAAARNCIVVLKGAGTVVAEPDGVFTMAATGNPGLATGGTGDVLAGLIGGLLAQGLEPSLAAQVGVLVHGAAGDIAAARLGQAGMCASDVVDALGTVWLEAGR